MFHPSKEIIRTHNVETLEAEAPEAWQGRGYATVVPICPLKWGYTGQYTEPRPSAWQLHLRSGKTIGGRLPSPSFRGARATVKEVASARVA